VQHFIHRASKADCCTVHLPGVDGRPSLSVDRQAPIDCGRLPPPSADNREGKTLIAEEIRAHAAVSVGETRNLQSVRFARDVRPSTINSLIAVEMKLTMRVDLAVR